jgi:energy-converting hydrogenase Eha subunit H
MSTISNLIIIVIIIIIIIITIVCNQQVQTDRTIPNNKPDIIIRDNEKRTCMLIDAAISGDRDERWQENSKT